MFTNLATGQILNTCDFFAYISSINWCSCTTDEVWLGNGVAKSGYDWFMYFQSNTPTCADQAPTCMAVHISDADQPGETISVLNFPAIGIPTPTKTYLWESSVDGITWVSTGITGASFIIAPTDVGKYIRIRGIADNGIGSPSVCYSGAVPIVPANASPINTIAPVISGSTTQGSTLTCTTGTWSGYPLPSFTFTWFADGQQVGTGNTYTLTLSDSNKNMTCVVTASNGLNPNGTQASNTITAGDYSPQNITAPTISGGASLGSQLTCSVGTWSGTNITYNYQWFSGATPVGDNSAQYQLVITDTLANITCVVTAVNPAGSNSATSNTITAGDYSPVNIVAPSIVVIGGGPANPGQVIECSIGTWQGNNIVYSYQWLNGITPIGTNSNTYQVQPSDIGGSITCVVTGTNLGGTASATSNNITVPSGPGVSPPSNVSHPTISVAGGGSPLTGATMVVSVGTWNGTSPIVYTYEWFSGLASVGTAPSYIIQASDYGAVITCVVTATNAYGVASQVSNSITAVGNAPTNVVAPSILGNNTPGDTLSINLGSWNASPPIALYTYLWQYSTDGGATWSNYAPLQTGATKVVITADIGRLIRCRVTASNPVGTGHAFTNSEYIDSAPINVTAPVVTGATLVGSVLTTTNGTWSGSGTITYTYRWLRNGVAIGGATSSTYTTILADSGANIQSEVTATNAIGPSVLASNVIVPTSPPAILQPPVIFGSYTSGSTLFLQDGVYTGTPSSTITRKWQYSTDSGVTWIDYAPLQTGTTYVVQPTDNGRWIRILETATNGITPDIITPSNYIEIASLGACGAIITGVPIISGIQIVSQTLTCDITPLSITGSPTPTISYQWYYGLTMIAGAVTSTYVLQPLQSGGRVWCRVTASNVNGTSFVDSNELAIFTTIADRYPTSWHSGWWPFLLRGAYYGQPLIRIRRESDNAEINISHDNNGYLNEALINSHCAGTIGRVVTIYDQIGTNNFTQATPANQPIIYTGGAIVKDNGIAVINNQSASGQQLLVTGSSAAGTYNFMHNGLTAAYGLYAVSKSANVVAIIIGTATTTTTTRGFVLLWTTTNTIRSTITNGAANVMNNTPGANTIVVPKTHVISMVNKPSNAAATLRGRLIANNAYAASNTVSAAPSTLNTTFDLYWGGTAIYQHMGVIIAQSEAFANEIHEAIRSQFNITY